MSRSDMLNLDYQQANKIISKCFRFVLYALILLGILVNTNIIVINKISFNFMLAISSTLLIMPTVIVDVLKINTKSVKYFIITISVIATSVSFLIMECNWDLVFIIPIIISLMYLNTKIVYVTSVLTVFTMTLSYILSYYVPFLNYNVYLSLSDTLQYGATPNILQLICISFIAVILSHRTSEMLRKFVDYASSIEKNKNILDTVIIETQSMFTTRSITELTKLIINTVYGIVSKIQGDISVVAGTVAIRDENGAFYSINENSESEIIEVIDGTVHAKCRNVSIIFPEHSQGSGAAHPVIVTSDGIFMPFYENEIIIGYVIFEINVNKDDVILNDILNILYNYIHLAIKNTKQNRDIYMNQEEIVCAFAEMSESKSQQTGKHIKRVAGYMKILAEESGYSEEKCINLSIAAMMHDVGKLVIPSIIIEKGSELTEEEFDIIKTHVNAGEALLKNSPGEIMQMAKIIALQHHEKWDGTGYLGLKGTEIDYTSRLMALADVFDALVSKRSYKGGWAPNKAYTEIIEQSGTHFDPNVVEIFQKRYDDFLTVLHSYPDEDQLN